MSAKPPLEKIADWAADAEGQHVYMVHDLRKRDVESPIEHLFLTAFYFVMRHETPSLPVHICSAERDFMSIPEGIATWKIWPQAHIGKYRCDFAVRHINWLGNWSDCFLVIECDGHDFHERTKEQASKDRARDRDLQLMGHTVFRFTGADIYRDPIACAQQAARWLATQFMRGD